MAKEISTKITIKNEDVEKLINSFEKLTDAMEKSVDKSKEVEKSFNFKKAVSKVLLLAKSIDNLTKGVDKTIASQNILNQTFGTGTTRINEYINKLSNMTGIVSSDIAKKTALFGEMATSLGMNADMASEFSIKLDDLSAKLALLYNIDFNSASKALLDAVKGESSTLTTLTGIVIKTQSLQNTLSELGINEIASNMTGANLAMLQYITIAKQINTSNQDMGKIANDVAWQKQLLRNQVVRLSNALGNLLYPVLRAILPVLNAILITISTILEVIGSILGVTDENTNSIQSNANAWANLGNSIENASNKAKKGLRSFDKLNNITTPTPSTTSGGGGIDPRLLSAMAETSQEMLNITTRAHEIADGILTWLGFTKDVNEKWKFGGVTLGTIVGLIVGGGGLIWGLSKILGIFKNLKNLEFGGILGTLLGGKNSKFSFSLPEWKTLGKGLAEIAAIIGAVGGIVTVYGMLMSIPYFEDFANKGIDMLVKTFKGIGSIVLELTGVSALIIALGHLAPAISTGLEGLALIITAMFIIVDLAGIIQDMFVLTGTDNVIDEGIELLVKLAYGVGEFAGAIVGGLSAGVMSGLPQIGTYLSEFADNSKSFFEILNNIDEGATRGVKNLAEVMLILGGEKLVNTILEVSSFGLLSDDGALVEFGEALSSLAPYLVSYSNTLKQGKFDGELVQMSANAALSLIEVNKGIPGFNGLKQAWNGTQDIAKWGEKLESFGTSLKNYSNNVYGFKASTIKASADSAMSLAELNDKLPTDDGWLQVINGSKDISKWGSKLVSFGTYLSQYSEEVDGLKTDVVEKSVNSATAIAELNDKLPKTSVLSWLTGDNSIDKWGAKLKDFGLYFHDFVWAMNGITKERLDELIGSIGSLVDISNAIKDKGITSTLKDFGDKLKSGADSFSTFFSISNAYSIGYNFGNSLAKGISQGLKNYTFPTISLSDKSFPYTNYGNFKIKAYAGGGFVDSADIFMTRENGLPEMVGRIGNRTAVANNDQIVEAVATGVARANMATKSSQKIEIIAKEKGGLLDYIDFEQKTRDRKYGF